MTGIGTKALSRRRLLFGRVDEDIASVTILPPWTTAASIAGQCTSCGDCIAACPEAILVADQHGRPFVDFNRDGCTFCGACAEACDHGVFAEIDGSPWSHRADITDACLLKSNISCQLCQDSCPESALRFDLSVRPLGAMRLNRDACTGCGACVSVCPADAIEITNEPGKHAADA